MKITDIELVHRINEEDVQAFQELYNRYWKPIYLTALHKLAEEEDAEDITQELFYSIWKRRKDIRINSSVEAYLFTILRFHVHDFYKAKEKKQNLDTNKIKETFQLTGTQESSPLLYDELKHIVEEEIDRMPEKMRKIYRMSRDNEMTAAEIASELSISVQTVRNQISNALTRIRECIKAYNKDCLVFCLLFLPFLLKY